MKKVVYPILALTLIFTPVTMAFGKPVKTESVEPNPVSTSVHATSTYNPFSTKFTMFELRKEKIMRNNEEVKVKKRQVTIASFKVEKEVISNPEPVALSQAKQEPSGKKMIFELTAYTAGYESTGKRPGDKGYGITYHGYKVKQGRTAACPKSFPEKTKLYVPSLDNTYYCEDTGSAITEGRLDIYFDDVDVALDFGRKKNVVVYVTKPEGN